MKNKNEKEEETCVKFIMKLDKDKLNEMKYRREEGW